ncbi:Caleosin-domain-containing protein [Hyaloscypha variabilis F]|uniref:Caleosin-domain-containing protein n=1 Tax=Hyaloscypha variabilis (strain UAMH 11265 / GT02V1 / F) TaxID=1149755 RepID=A0A2J6S6W7_HYAVF|nr:Caleosin-domain-containing protein [Hyaloscypha variabilis F]
MAPARTEEDGFDVSIKEVPVTEQRRPFIQKVDNQELKDPGTARANEAASVEAPNGTEQNNWTRRHRDQSVLQQHVAFFDTDSDGVIWPLETFNGFHRLGYHLFFCILSVFIIHANFSYPTVSGWLPDPFFRVYTARIHKDKHGSDSGTYDPEGRFVPQKFEDIFSKYASGDKQGITLGEVFNYLKGQRVVFDPFGWGGAFFEWMATYLLLWPEDGRMKKEDI